MRERGEGKMTTKKKRKLFFVLPAFFGVTHLIMFSLWQIGYYYFKENQMDVFERFDIAGNSMELLNQWLGILVFVLLAALIVLEKLSFRWAFFNGMCRILGILLVSLCPF